MPADPPRIGFILGVLQRSGTNHLYNLIGRHPDCATPGPLWEDFFVRSLGTLKRYTQEVRRKWNPVWQVESRVGALPVLWQGFGAVIEDYLRRQLPADGRRAQLLLTKTPSAIGAWDFHAFFPEARLILLVRDGRAVVESGVRSFGWQYEDAMQAWKNGAQAIADLLHAAQRDGRPLLLVRYEDLFRDPDAEMTRILGFLGLDPARYDFAGARRNAIVGSSESRADTGQVHWRAQARDGRFDPLHRHAGWSQRRRERFHWLAGALLERFGYATDAVDSTRASWRLRNRLLDLRWRARLRWQSWRQMGWRWREIGAEVAEQNYGRLDP